jgi:hypothetical protein
MQPASFPQRSLIGLFTHLSSSLGSLGFMKFRLIPAIIIGIALSLVTSRIVYFGFTPNYGGATLFSKKGFHFQFDHDVFQYRILSKYLLLTVDDWLGNSMPENGAEARILALTKTGSQRLYTAFFYLNTFFICLISIIIGLLLRLKNVFALTDSEKYLLLYTSVIVINLSQFVVSPYDVSSYFFQLLILYVFLFYSDKEYSASIVAICALIFLSTLNRESSALSVSVVTLLLLLKFGISRKSIVGICLISACFLSVYLALRYLITDPEKLKFGYRDARHFIDIKNVTGIIFWGIFFYFTLAIANGKENRLMIIAYHLFCLPYILTCVTVGVFWEIRLYIPLLLCSIFLSKLDPKLFKIRTSNLRVKDLFTKAKALSRVPF